MDDQLKCTKDVEEDAMLDAVHEEERTDEDDIGEDNNETEENMDTEETEDFDATKSNSSSDGVDDMDSEDDEDDEDLDFIDSDESLDSGVDDVPTPAIAQISRAYRVRAATPVPYTLRRPRLQELVECDHYRSSNATLMKRRRENIGPSCLSMVDQGDE